MPVWRPILPGEAFHRSDPQLDRIWEISADITKLCMQQCHEDGIKRDRLLWISDDRVLYLTLQSLAGKAQPSDSGCRVSR